MGRHIVCCVQDYADLIQTHRKSNADITIATHAVGKGQASYRGCCKVEADTGKHRMLTPYLLVAAVHVLTYRLKPCLNGISPSLLHHLNMPTCILLHATHAACYRFVPAQQTQWWAQFIHVDSLMCSSVAMQCLLCSDHILSHVIDQHQQSMYIH